MAQARANEAPPPPYGSHTSDQVYVEPPTRLAATAPPRYTPIAPQLARDDETSLHDDHEGAREALLNLRALAGSMRDENPTIMDMLLMQIDTILHLLDSRRA